MKYVSKLEQHNKEQKKPSTVYLCSFDYVVNFLLPKVT